MLSWSRVFVFLTACLASTLSQELLELCDGAGNGHIHGILSDPDDQILIIKGDNYWKLDGNLTDGFSLSPGYPRKVNTYWPGLNTSIYQAIYNPVEAITYFLKDEKVWAYNGTVLLPGYPKNSSDDPFFRDTDKDNVSEDTKRLNELAYQSRAIGVFPFARTHLYFFYGNHYLKYRMPSGPIEDGYPKPMVPFWFQCPVSSSEELAVSE